MGDDRPKFVKLAAFDFRAASRDERELECAAKLFDVEVVCAQIAEGKEPFFKTSNGFPIHRLEVSRTFNNKILNHFATAFLWRKQLQALHADCMSCHDMSALTIGWVSSLFMRDKPVLVYDAHEFELGRNSNRKRGALMRKTVFFLERFLMKRCAFTIVVNDSIADRMQEVYKLEERPVVVRNTPHRWELDPEETARKRAEFCSALGAGKDAFLVMYHGVVMRGRGIENLIRAVAADESLRAIVLGDGEEGYLASLRDLARDEGVSGRVLFTPAVPIDELRHSVSAADCGAVTVEALCESYYYMLPNKFFECIQSETPVVASDFPETGKIVREYGIGVTCDPSDVDSLVRAFSLLRDEQGLRAECKRNLRKAKEELCWDREKVVLERAYRGIVEEMEQAG